MFSKKIVRKINLYIDQLAEEIFFYIAAMSITITGITPCGVHV